MAKKEISRAEQKRKEREAKQKKNLTESDGTRTTWETICWVAGMFLLLFSLYALAAVIVHLFVWRNDLGALENNPMNHAVEVKNICSEWGAKLANLLTGRSFGLFGLLVPVIGVVFGGFLWLERSRVLWRTALSIMLITICGSLTLGAIFGADGFLGTGWGGEYGIAIIELLKAKIGGVGVFFSLVACWILTGIFINLHFIDFVKRTTENGMEQSKDLLSSLKLFVARKGEALKARAEKAKRSSDAVEESTNIRKVGATAETPEVPTTPAVEEVKPTAEPVVTLQPKENVVEQPQPAVVETPEVVDAPKTNIEVVEVIEHTEKQRSSAEVDNRRPYDPDSTPKYKFPSVEMLVNYENGVEVSNDEIEQNKQRIEETLGNFGVPIVSMTATIGPTVTLYEIVQEPGVKIARVQGLEKDIAQSLKALGIRIIAPIPGKGTIGIEVPNRNKETVSMRSAIQSERFQSFKAELPVVIGRTIQNENYVFDLAKMPHLLVAGATGQGKSVGLNAIIASLLYRKDPSQLKFVLIDPKTVEFSL